MRRPSLAEESHRRDCEDLTSYLYTLRTKMVVKLSANTLSWSQEFAAGNMTLLDMIEECYNLRLDGVSPAQPHFASTDDGYLEEVKQAAISRGLHFDYIGVSTNHAQLGEDREANIANLKKWIDVAAKMGIPMCRTFGGWLREGARALRIGLISRGNVQ